MAESESQASLTRLISFSKGSELLWDQEVTTQAGIALNSLNSANVVLKIYFSILLVNGLSRDD